MSFRLYSSKSNLCNPKFNFMFKISNGYCLEFIIFKTISKKAKKKKKQYKNFKCPSFITTSQT